jgi:cyclase
MENVFRVTDRRSLLKQTAILSGSALLLFHCAGSLAQVAASTSTSSSPVQTQRLADKVLFVKGPDSNVLVVDSSEGLIMVDGGHTDWFGELHAAIEENFPGRPYRALFNTHWHPEQSGSNQTLGEQGVEIIAHENTMLWQSTEVWQRWSDKTFAPLPAAALPKTVFFDDGSMQIGDRTVQYGYMRDAHTDGDIWVYFEDEDILVTGGLVSNGRWPEIDWWTGGFIGGMMDGFVSLMSVPNANTKIIPAYGDVMTLDELREQNQMYITIFDRLHRSYISSDSFDDIVGQKPTAEFDAKMGDPTQFLKLAFDSVQGHIRDPQNDRFLNIP